ncbi:MAG: hypothetical protein ACEY3F_00550 [Wolbachia sp.]
MPTSIRFCKGQEEGSEDIALVRAINEAKVKKEDILLFDRGIRKVGTFAEFDEKEYKFITRVETSRKHDVVSRSKVIQGQQQDGSEILEDIIVNIYMIIITALLFLVYKIKNNLHGFKMALLQFTLDLNDSFIRLIVLLSGGNLHVVDHLISRHF